jgi:hypothetical protein
MKSEFAAEIDLRMSETAPLHLPLCLYPMVPFQNLRGASVFLSTCSCLSRKSGRREGPPN